MNLFPWIKKKEFFTNEEKQLIATAIKDAEQMTSGEVRVFVESRCSYMNAMDRATEIFAQLEMYKTEARNAVLLYIAIKDRQLAIFGDEGIHQKVGQAYWNKEVQQLIQRFDKKNYAEGIKEVVLDIGEVLTTHFPYNHKTDRNELSNEISFGK